MNIPKTISDLVAAQNRQDSVAYAQCFAQDTIAIDEGTTYIGRSEFRNWIEKANEKYHSPLAPLQFKEDGAEVILKVRVSGTFEGSPTDMNII